MYTVSRKLNTKCAEISKIFVKLLQLKMLVFIKCNIICRANVYRHIIYIAGMSYSHTHTHICNKSVHTHMYLNYI